MTKKALRNQVIQHLKRMDMDEYKKRSEQIIKHLIAQDAYQSAQVIGVTVSRFPEVDTKPLIEAAWKAGKKVAVPKCIPSTRAMDFRIFNSYEDLEIVYVDLLEPIVDKTTTISKESIDLLIVPGVVYSDQGYRIGFGGGYYDRYMSNYAGRTISLAFERQLNENILVEEHDIPVQAIITEHGRIDCQRK